MEPTIEDLKAQIATLGSEISNLMLERQAIEDRVAADVLALEKLEATLNAIRACQRSTGSGGGHMQAIVEIDRLLTAAGIE